MADRYVRPDVRTLESDADGAPRDERVRAYARAVAAMQARPPEDPGSWAAQAALHRHCPRGTWFFLPWLRMHLWYLERIMRAIVVDGGGPRDWALPFWGYTDGPARAVLPPAFAVPALPDGAPNPLHRPDGERAASLNAGRPLPDAVASAARALSARTFAPGVGGNPDVASAASDAAPAGLLEAQPHDTISAVVGRNAALDPVFPLHLANVDRLWEIWLARGDGRANPPQFDWTDQAFCFHDVDGRSRSLTSGQVGDLANLDYAYAGLPAPVCAGSVLKPGADCGPLGECRGWRGQIAGGDAVELGAETRRVALCPSAETAADSDAVARATRVYLCLEDAGGEGVPGSVWEVRVEGGRVRAAEGNGGAPVGTIAFAAPDAGAQRFVFDITGVVGGPTAGFRDAPMVVSFHPALPPGFVVEPTPGARIGRVLLVCA